MTTIIKKLFSILYKMTPRPTLEIPQDDIITELTITTHKLKTPGFIPSKLDTDDIVERWETLKND